MHSVFSHVVHQFKASFLSLRRTQTLATAGVYLAIQMVLSSLGAIQVSESLKISLGHLALAPTAMLFGPVVAGMQGALSDVLGLIIKPVGPYFPGFTISAALGGVVYGLFFYRNVPRLSQIVASRLIICLFINILLNTFFLTMLYGPAQAAALPVRMVKNLVQLPVDCVLLTAVCRIVHRLPHPAGVR